jgi:hypothetical protein
MQNILYMADTGSETDENDKIIPAALMDRIGQKEEYINLHLPI